MLPESKVRFAAAMCYLPFASVVAGLITLLKFPHQPFAIFHVRNAFALFLIWFISLILLALFIWVGLVFWLVLLVVSFKFACSAWLGHEKSFPWLSGLARMMPVEAIYSHLTGRDFPRH